jgi:membrane protein DedA with SNARE-associated domain
MMHEMSSLLAQHGLALVFVNVLLTQLGLPLPALPLLIVAGALIHDGQMAAAPLFAVATLASLMGDTAWYYAGRRYGYRVLRTLCRVAIEPDGCVRQTENIFERWGAPSLMFAKFIPGFATIAPPLAGAMRLPLPLFAAYSAVSALLWAGAAVVIGLLFHAQIDWVIQKLSDMGGSAALVVGGVLGFYLGARWIERLLFIRLMREVRISVEELRELMTHEPLPLILDVRSLPARRSDPRRIPGAVAVDFGNPDSRLAREAREREVVVYCS